MTRRLRSSALAVTAALLPLSGSLACEDPIIIVGDLPGIMHRAAGVPNLIGSNVDSLANRTRLHEPRGLATGADGTLFIADSRNARIVAVSPAGRARVLASAADCESDCLVAPHGVAVADDGLVWIADPGAHRVFRLDPVTGILEVRAGTGVAGDAPDGTLALEAELRAPTGIAIGPGGTPYFSEYGGHRIRWIVSQGALRTLAGTGEAGYSGDGVPALAARLDSPAGMAIHASLLYFADEKNHRVRSVSLSGGAIRNVAGNGVAGFSETDTIAIAAKLNRPMDVAVTPDGQQLFIADTYNHRVRAVRLDAGRIRRFAGTGSPLFDGEGLDAADTSLELPGGLTVHDDGTLFLSDTGHHIVWRTPLRF